MVELLLVVTGPTQGEDLGNVDVSTASRLVDLEHVPIKLTELGRNML
jgi:hypothetical protein